MGWFEEGQDIHPLAKVIAGAIIVVAAAYALPIQELVALFVLVVAVPYMFLLSIAWVAEGTTELLFGGTARAGPDLHERISHYRAELRAQSALQP